MNGHDVGTVHILTQLWILYDKKQQERMINTILIYPQTSSNGEKYCPPGGLIKRDKEILDKTDRSKRSH